jgi:hypothetical protein
MKIKKKKFLFRSEVKARYLEAFLRDIKTKPEEVFDYMSKYIYTEHSRNYEFEGELNGLFDGVIHVIKELCPFDGLFCSFGRYNIEDGICKYYQYFRDNPKWKEEFS